MFFSLPSAWSLLSLVILFKMRAKEKLSRKLTKEMIKADLYCMPATLQGSLHLVTISPTVSVIIKIIPILLKRHWGTERLSYCSRDSTQLAERVLNQGHLMPNPILLTIRWHCLQDGRRYRSPTDSESSSFCFLLREDKRPERFA